MVMSSFYCSLIIIVGPLHPSAIHWFSRRRRLRRRCISSIGTCTGIRSSGITYVSSLIVIGHCIRPRFVGSVDSYEDLTPSEPSSYTVGRTINSAHFIHCHRRRHLNSPGHYCNSKSVSVIGIPDIALTDRVRCYVNAAWSS